MITTAEEAIEYAKKIEENNKLIFEPKEGREYWGIGITDGQPLCMTYNSAFYSHVLNKAIGNCFQTADEALEHRHEIWKRFKELIAYAKTLNK